MTRLSDAIDRLAAAVPNGELMASADPAALLDEAASLITAAEQRGYERGLREGREAERADVVAWLRATCSGPEHVTIAAIERGQHVPTPQGDEPVALVPLTECESNDSNKPAEPEEWGWYFDGGSLRGSRHPTREAAVREAVVDYEAEHFYVGRMVDLDLAQWVDSERIAEGVREDIYGNLGLEDVDVSAAEGAEEALEAWARKYLETDTPRYCDGEEVRVSRSQARRLAAQRGEAAPSFGPERNEEAAQEKRREENEDGTYALAAPKPRATPGCRACLGVGVVPCGPPEASYHIPCPACAGEELAPVSWCDACGEPKPNPHCPDCAGESGGRR